MNIVRIVVLALFGVGALTDTALAVAVSAPGPIAGVGLPALVVIGGAYWIGRKFLGRKR